jgi:hypothetical protein
MPSARRVHFPLKRASYFNIEVGGVHTIFHQLLTAYVAYDNVLIPIDDLSAELMERIRSTTRRLSV